MSSLKKKYNDEVRQKLQEQFKYKNPMQVPRLEKVVVNMGIAEATKDRNIMQDHINELSMICGQRPITTKAKKSISNFKLREGQEIGLQATLRGARMYDFVYRLINLVCPRIRDFRGLKSKCDGRGNYSMGVTSQDIFAEVDLDALKRTQGMNITFVTTASTDEEAVALLGLLGMPFKK